MKKEKSKNLIVIIGNGFDLAHGLKTRFSDFAEYYVKDVICQEILNASSGESPKVLKNIFTPEYLKLLEFQKIDSEDYDNIKNLINQILHFSKSGNIDSLKDFFIGFLVKNNFSSIPYLIANSFLAKLYSNSYDNWFDIEQAYYEELVKIHTSDFSTDQKKEKLIELNNNLSDIRDAFQDYLFEIKYYEDKNVYYSLKTHFKERESVCFINFNYTYTVEQYERLKKDDELSSTLKRLNHIHIHGQVQQDIVFGYGDDTDQYYQEMKSTKEKEYLRNFKTFEYLGRHEYRQVLNELATHDNYDVLIIGHSLDTTDRTILNTILDTEKCQYIELLKRSDIQDIDKQNEYHFELHANLSRIFDNEADLREKVISSLQSVHFPIMTDKDSQRLQSRYNDLYLEPVKLE